MLRSNERQAVGGLVLAAVSCAVAMAWAALARGDDFTWDSPGSGTANWSNSGNWAGPSGRFPDDPNEQAIFNSPAGMDMPIQNAAMPNGVGKVTFNYTGWTVYTTDPLRMDSISVYGDYNAINCWATGGAGDVVMYPAVEFLTARQNIHTASGATLRILGGFTGYAPIISSFNPTSDNTGVVRLETGSNIASTFLLRQGTLQVATTSSTALGTTSDFTIGDSYTASGANARLLTTVANVTIAKNITVNNISGHEVNATLGGSQASGNTTFTGTVAVNRDTVLTAANADDGTTVAFSNTISGTAGIVKKGDGTVQLGHSNSYAGGTSVQYGKLQLTAGGALPSTTSVSLDNRAGAVLDLNGYSQTVASLSGGGGSGGNVTLGAGTLTVGSGSYAGAITGNGGVSKNTSGTLTLSGSNNYNGLTNITAGTLALGASNVIGAGDVTVNGATAVLSLGAYSDAVGVVALDGGGQITGSGALWSSSDFQLKSGAASAILAGNVGLSKTTAGTVTLGGANAFTGETRIVGGTLRLTHASALQSSTVDMNVADGGALDLNGLSATLGGLKGSRSVTIPSGQVLTIGNNDAGTTYSGALGGGGGGGGLTKAGAGTTILSGPCGYSGTTVVSGGTLQIGDGGTSGSIDTNVTDEANLAFNRFDDVSFARDVSGGGTLTKLGGGKLTLSGNNSYAGTTFVNAGRLLVNGTHSGTGLFAVAPMAWLGGTGSIAGSVRLGAGGVLAPGESIGTLTIAGEVRSASALTGGTFRIELGSTTEGEDYAGLCDLADVGGLLDIKNAAVDFDVYGTPRASAYVFAKYGLLGGSKFATVIDLPAGYSIDYHYQGNQIALVPEPATLSLLALGGPAVMRRRRRETMNFYADPVLLDVAGAVEALPDFNGKAAAGSAEA